MATSSKAPHQPGTYVKGDSARVANSVSAAVALVFDGYTLQVEGPAEDAKSTEGDKPTEVSQVNDSAPAKPAAKK